MEAEAVSQCLLVRFNKIVSVQYSHCCMCVWKRYSTLLILLVTANRSSYRYHFPWACRYITVSYRSQYIQLHTRKQKINYHTLTYIMVKSFIDKRNVNVKSRTSRRELAFTDFFLPVFLYSKLIHTENTLNRIMRGKSLLRIRMKKRIYLYQNLY